MSSCLGTRVWCWRQTHVNRKSPSLRRVSFHSKMMMKIIYSVTGFSRWYSGPPAFILIIAAKQFRDGNPLPCQRNWPMSVLASWPALPKCLPLCSPLCIHWFTRATRSLISHRETVMLHPLGKLPRTRGEEERPISAIMELSKEDTL